MSRLDEQFASTYGGRRQRPMASSSSSGDLPRSSIRRTRYAHVPAGCDGPVRTHPAVILASADWRGPQHRIFEALPHLGPIGSFRMLRTVLARLDVRLIPSRAASL